MNVSEIGTFIKTNRKNLNMTQQDLADLLNLSPQAVSKWERGECLPDISLIPCLAEIFSITIEELLNYGEEKENISLENILMTINAFVDEEIFHKIINDFKDSPSVFDLSVPLDIFMYLNNEQKNILLKQFLNIKDYSAVIDNIMPYFNSYQRDIIVNNIIANKDFETIEILILYLSKTNKSKLLKVLLEQSEFNIIENLIPFLSGEQKDLIIDFVIENKIGYEFLENCIPFFSIKQRKKVEDYIE